MHNGRRRPTKRKRWKSTFVGIVLALVAGATSYVAKPILSSEPATKATSATVSLQNSEAANSAVGNSAAANSTAVAASELAVLPERFTLSGSSARQPLLVERRRGADFIGDVARGDIAWSSGNPQVAVVKAGVATPVGNGTATLTAKVGDRSATAQITVVDQEHAAAASFRNQVEAVLAKNGCNSGACHGAAAGKNGFKLSLRGYDPDADYFTITRQARGRRIVPDDPSRSLLLLKPTGALAHKGGVRFEVDSPDYRLMLDWLAASAPPPTADDPQLERLEVLPERVTLKPGDDQNLLVRAHYTDGRTAEVTRWVKFSSSDESVAPVDAGGHVKVVAPGQCVVSGWFASRIVVATINVPFLQPLPADAIAKAPRRNFIDELSLAKLKRLNLPPSPRASDGQFIRRAMLDTIGVLPTAEETRQFLADSKPDKRDRLIDSLLHRKEFVDYWTYKWSDLLLVNSEKLPKPAMWTYSRWIRSQVEQNIPWDQVARSVVTATGSTLENGPASFFVLHQDPMELAETTSQAFLGMSITCAHCHNHPLEKWTNDQYYGMANLFSRVQVKNAEGEGNWTVFPTTSGELIQPRTGRPQRPCPLDGEPIAFDAPGDRREVLARWLTAPENPYFSRAICNRVWANFFGVGLVEAVDDMRLTNPPSNAELLAALAKFMIDNRYDVQALIRVILESETYQRSSEPLPQNMVDRRFYSHCFPRRLKAEVLLDAISEVTGAPTEFSGYAHGWRAEQLPDSNVDSYFLKSFGRPVRLLTCECERTSTPSMVQVLHISNGNTLNQKLTAKGNRLDQMLAAKTPPDAIIDEAYLAAYSRFPSTREKQQLLQLLGKVPADQQRLAIEDLYWSLLSSTEFLFNH